MHGSTHTNLTKQSEHFRLPPLLDRALASRVLQGLILLASVYFIAKRAAGISALKSDSWSAIFAALEYLAENPPELLFESLFFEQGIKFQYPPSSLLFLAPLYELGLRTPGAFNTLNLLALVMNALLIAVLAYRLGVGIFGPSQRSTIAMGALFVGLFYEPIMLGYTIGQIQVVLNLLFTASCLMLLSGAERRSGALMCLTTAIKPQYGLILLIQTISKRWGFVLGFCLTGLLIAGLSVWMYGWESHTSYLKVLGELSQRGEAFHLNESVNGIAHRLLDERSGFLIVETAGIPQSPLPPFKPVVRAWTVAAMFVFLALPFFVVALLRPSRADNLLLFSLASVCFVLASPIAWTHHYGILLPAYFVLLRPLLMSSRIPYGRLALLGLSFVLTGLRFPEFRDAQGWWTLLHAPVFFGACLLVALQVWQLAVQARSRSTSRSNGQLRSV